MKLSEAVKALDDAVPNPNLGLPDEIFYYISKTTPLINVDLLIKDELGRTLLTWRDDLFAGKGWHVPGGIIRFKETFEDRIRQVALSEIGTEVEYDLTPLAVNQIICPDKEYRAHFISILYGCKLPSSFVPDNKNLTPSDAGYIRWNQGKPDNLLKYHEIYTQFF